MCPPQHQVTSARRNLPGDDGATLVEYGMLVGLISVVCLLVIAAVTTHIFNAFDSAQQSVQPSQPGLPS